MKNKFIQFIRRRVSIDAITPASTTGHRLMVDVGVFKYPGTSITNPVYITVMKNLSNESWIVKKLYDWFYLKPEY